MRKTTEQAGAGAQLAMAFADRALADDATAQVLEELRAGVAELGPGRAVIAADVKPSVLSEALSSSVNSKAKRQPQLRWFARLLLAMPIRRRFTMLRPLAELCGLELSIKKTRTPEERCAELERALLSFGDEGKRKLDGVPR